MKILHTSEFYYPSIGGAQEVVRQLSERMVAAGHEVTVVTSPNSERRTENLRGVRVVEFPISGNWVRGMEGPVDEYRDFVHREGFDAIMNYAAQQWTTDALLEHLGEIRAKKILVPCGFSGLRDPDYWKYFENMRGWMKQYDHTVFLAERYQDIDFAREWGIANGVIIPNGVDEREFANARAGTIRRWLEIPDDWKVILTIGSHTGAKGHAESLAVFEALGHSKVAFVLVGNSIIDGCAKACEKETRRLNRRFEKEGIEKRVFNLESRRSAILDLLFHADLFLFLSNIESSPIVLFEASAAGLPFLSTDVGNSREISEWLKNGDLTTGAFRSENGRTFAAIPETAAAVDRMLAKPATAEVRKETRRITLSKFTWEKIARRYLDLYAGDSR